MDTRVRMRILLRPPIDKSVYKAGVLSRATRKIDRSSCVAAVSS